MALSISRCPKFVCAYSSTSEQEKSYTASTKVLGSSQKSGPVSSAKLPSILRHSTLLGNLRNAPYIHRPDSRRPVP